MPDAKVVARKILSCVARVKQTWGIGHVTDILLGRATEKVVAAGHAELSTFALLKDEPSARPARLCRTADRRWLSVARRGSLSGAPLDAAGNGVDARGRRMCPLSRTPAASENRPRRETAVVAAVVEGDLFDAFARCACASPGNAACLPTSSFTTRRCGTWSIDGRRRSTNYTTCTALASEKGGRLRRRLSRRHPYV